VTSFGLILAFLLHRPFGIMGENPVKKLHEIRRDYIRHVLDAVNWDFRKASLILKVSEKFLRKQVTERRGDRKSSK
jgi:hypothetical protein